MGCSKCKTYNEMRLNCRKGCRVCLERWHARADKIEEEKKKKKTEVKGLSPVKEEVGGMLS